MTNLKTKITLLILCCFSYLFVLGQSADYEPGELLIKWKTTTSPANRTNLKAELRANEIKRYSSVGIELWKVAEEQDLTIEEIVNKYKKHPDVEFIEPNYLYTIGQNIPSDEKFGDLWGMNNTGQGGGKLDADIDAAEAWSVVNKSTSVKVAIIDTGIDWKHADLRENIWKNLGEDADGDGKVIELVDGNWVLDPGDINNVDDDGNGYIDDLIGWDFRNEDNDPLDGNGHGTHVAGTIGAVGENSIGVSGVTWGVQLAGLKFLSNRGGGRNSDAVEAINYAANNGFHISNNSWGGSNASEALRTALEAAAAKNHLVIAAAGNSSNNADSRPNYPAAYDLPNIVSVASTDREDNLSYFSNYGLISVDLGAPGSEILSCYPNDSYRSISGTSMASPHVAGACALLWGMDISKTPADIKSTLLATGDAIPSLDGKTVTGKRLNLCKLVGGCGTQSSCRQTDSLALVQFYNATNGPNWTVKWDLSQPINTWFGVTLNATGCVNRLVLISNQLSGSIPSAIGTISELEFLILQSNQLSGDIPISIGNLPNLTQLLLGGNQFTGPLPPIFGNLISLQTLFLNDNQFTGPIPASFGDLDSLVSLNLSNNQLSGQLPSELADLAKIESLNFRSNQFTGCFPQNYKEKLCGLSDFSDNSGLGDFDAFCVDGTDGCTDGKDPVWPGDLNNDGRVDATDFAFGGLSAGKTGPPRSDQGTDWSAKPSEDWTNEAGGVKGQHQDANGDGVVNATDLGVVSTNFDSTHATTNALSSFFADGTILSLRSLDIVNGNLRYGLFARKEGQGVMIHGLSCSIEFNKFNVANASFDTSNSCLEPDEDFYFFDPNSQKLSVALTRTDKIDRFCNSDSDTYLGIITVTPDGEITNDTLLLEIDDARVMTADGSFKSAVGSSLYDPYSAFAAAGDNMLIKVSVTPEDCRTLGTATVTIEGGSSPYNIEWSTGANNETIIDLFAGSYSVTVTDSGGNPSEVVNVEIDKQFVPIFDNTGRLIECTEFTSACPGSLTTPTNLVSETYQAGINLVSTGTVAAGSDVTFKAGETITLQPGFTVAAGGIFLATIEGCTGANNAGRVKTIPVDDKPNVLLDNQPNQQAPLTISIKPNPLRQQAIIEYNLPSTTTIQMTLVDIQGKSVRQLLDNVVQEAGQHQLTFNADNLPKGMYLVTLQTPEHIETRKMILLK